MTKNGLFNFIKLNQHIQVEVDQEGMLAKRFHLRKQIPAYLFILCTQGECEITTHLSSYTLKKNELITILPNSFMQVLHQSANCKLYITAFHKDLLANTASFTTLMDCVECILQSPVLPLQPPITALLQDYMLLLQRTTHTTGFKLSSELASTQLLSFFHAVSNCYQTNAPQEQSMKRGEEIVKELTRHIIKHYRQERNVSFYANLLHISPQHLSSTVNKVTGKTATDIIAQLVITDASSKLKSSDMTIQEIAYSLNFSDTSFFGKYFKRYTGLSPRQYRHR